MNDMGAIFMGAIVSAVASSVFSSLIGLAIVRNNAQWLEKMRNEDKADTEKAHAALWRRIDQHSDALTDLERRKADK